MKATEPEPQLSAEEKAIADVLRKRVRPAAAPVDFTRRLLTSGPPVVPFAVAPLKQPAAKFRFMAAGMAAAAAVALAWLLVQPPMSLPRQIAVEAKTPEPAGQTVEEPAAPQSSPAVSGVKPAPGMHAARFFSAHEVAVIRRENGLPPVQLVAVNNLRIHPGNATLKIEVESRLIPVVLAYH